MNESEANGRRARHALILANRLPFPLDDGWKVRTFHMIRAAASHARATVLVFHPQQDRATIEAAGRALGPDVRLETIDPPRPYTPGAVLRGLFTRLPVHVWNQESVAMRSRVREIVAKDPVDVLVSESTFMARYFDLVPDAPRVVDTHNVDSVTFSRYVQSLPRGPRRWYAAVTARRIATLEADTYRTASDVWVCSDLERELAARIAPGCNVHTVPNGVDTTTFAPGTDTPIDGRILFFGRLDYYPNVDGISWFVREVLPRLLAARPDARLHVVGAAATDALRSRAAHPAVQLVGRVDDLRAEIAKSAAVVVPLRVGGGTRLKILEALSMARPVITTTIGAEGLPVAHERDLLLADEPQAFADAVLSVLDDADLAARLGRNGRALVCERFDWEHVRGIVSQSLDALTGTDT